MVDLLYSDFPMEMDLLGEEDKEVANKEKMVLEGSKAIDIVIKMKNDGKWPILGKRGRVLGLNSSKKRYGMNKITREQEEGRRGTRLEAFKSIP